MFGDRSISSFTDTWSAFAFKVHSQFPGWPSSASKQGVQPRQSRPSSERLRWPGQRSFLPTEQPRWHPPCSTPSSTPTTTTTCQQTNETRCRGSHALWNQRESRDNATWIRWLPGCQKTHQRLSAKLPLLSKWCQWLCQWQSAVLPSQWSGIQFFLSGWSTSWSI